MDPDVWKAALEKFGPDFEFDLEQARRDAKARLAERKEEQQAINNPIQDAIEESGRSLFELAEELAEKLPHKNRSIDAMFVAAVASGEHEDLEAKITLVDTLRLKIDVLSPELFGFSTALHESETNYQERESESSPSQINSLEYRTCLHEFSDFVDAKQAEALVQTWEEDSSKLQDYVVAEFEGDHSRLIIRMLCALVLTKDSEEMERLEESLVSGASNPLEQMNALYLRGRSRWYRNLEHESVADLQTCIGLAQDLFQQVRESQCLYYLARIKIKHAGLVEGGKAELLERGTELARKAGRFDIELLIGRAKVIDLRLSKQGQESASEAKALLDRAALVPPGLVDHIVAFLRNDYGIALRGLKRETDRIQAEQIYDANIRDFGQLAVAGQSRYLKADLYIDRAVQAWSNALVCSDDKESDQLLLEAENARQSAIELCLTSQNLLSAAGDWPAFRKAAARLMTLRGQSIKLPQNTTDVDEDYSARHDRIAAILLGAPIVSSDGQSLQSTSLNSDAKLEELLNHYFQGLLTEDEEPQNKDTFLVDNFLNESTLLAIPIVVGNSMTVQAYYRDPANNNPTPLGAFAVEGYGESTRNTFEQLGRFGDEAHKSILPKFASRLQDQVATANSLMASELHSSNKILDVLVLPPLNSRDWPCPIEWLATKNDQGRSALSLLDFAQDSLVFASSPAPLASKRVAVANQSPTLLATDQPLTESETVRDAVSNITGRDFLTIQFDEANAPPKIPPGLAIIVGHNDDQHQLATRLLGWDWSEADAVALLFCSSGQYQASYGPYVDSVSHHIRRSMKREGIVVGARLPVMMEEAGRFASALLDEPNTDQPFVSVVTEYLRYAKRFGGNGLLHPWVIVS
ncbi:MAG: hypothetical protein AAF483_14120 [Planctomycetota bacterium]